MNWSPRFEKCTTCGELTSGAGECFDCVRSRDRRAEAVRSLEATIPVAFRWARLDEGPLAARVAPPGPAAATTLISSRRLVLVGISGAGKTSLAVAMARAWVRHRAKPGAFVLATDLATARRRTPMGREAPEVLEALQAPLLVLDDLGSEAQEASSAVTEVIFKRHAEDRVTWITTWMDEEKMIARYGEGVARRVFEGARILELGAR